jgi:hypothetical protein
MNDVHELSQRALALAISRYVIDHPMGAHLARSWLVRLKTPELAFLSADQVRSDAAATFDQVDQLVPSAEDRIELAHARLALEAAHSGSFATAAGSLADFLREAGEAPSALDIH